MIISCLPYGAFNKLSRKAFHLVRCKYTINNRAKRRITSSELIVSVLHLLDVSDITIGRVRYGQGQKESVSVLCIPDVSGIAEIKTLIGLQLSLWSIYLHISTIYSEACGLPNLSGLWASLELKFKYGKLFGCSSKIKNWHPNS